MRQRYPGECLSLAIGNGRIRCASLLQRNFRGDADKAIERRVMLLDTVQVVLRDFDAGKFSLRQPRTNLDDSSGHYSITLGTRYRPCSTSGAIC